MMPASLAAILVSAAGAVAQAPDTPPASFTGAWEVEHVAVDRADQPHWEYRPDDPMLVGRELVVGADAVRFSLGHDATCTPPRWKRHSTTWATLLDQGFPREGAARTMPADYGLSVSRKARVVAYAVCTTPPERLAAGVVPNWAHDDVWLVQQGPDKLLMHLDGQVLLTLARRSPVAKPRASFPCDRASTPTEKAICSSFTLAALDRSVALAWRRGAEDTNPTRLEEQRAWLHTRNACGADTACLEKQMTQRITQPSHWRETRRTTGSLVAEREGGGHHPTGGPRPGASAPVKGARVVGGARARLRPRGVGSNTWSTR